MGDIISSLAALDTIMRAVHVIGAIIAVGGVVATDILFGVMHFKPKMAKTLAQISPILSGQVWLGFILLGISGVILFLPRPWLAGETMFVFKLVLVIIAFVNGIFLNVYADPNFEKLAPEWEEKTDRVKKFEYAAGASAAVSMLSWWGVILLSLYLVHWN